MSDLRRRAMLAQGTGRGCAINALDYCTRIVFGRYFPSTTPDIYLPLATSLESIFYHDRTTSPYTSIKISFDKQITSLSNCFGCYRQSVHGLLTVTIDGDLSKCTNYSAMAKGNSDLVEIKGTPLNFSSVTNANYSNWGSLGGNNSLLSLTYVRYAPGTLKVDHSLAGCPVLSNDSLVSIANGLAAVAKTITFHNDIKARLSMIYGTVADGAFTETGDSGDTTLVLFIESKGWTVA